jgi:hypothetical protein
MKTLVNPEDTEEILARLGAIGPASQRQWGRMTVAEMVCHLNDALVISMGERQATPKCTWFSRTLMKWGGLWSPTQWPHGVMTVPECDAQRLGTRPAEMENDMRVLRESFERFTRRPRVYALQAHPIFGQLTEKEWMRWGYLHMDHHLRQFGA